ncbi:MAG: DUF456 domain-containing protein [Gemmatimonadales bacterium]|nr:DUF456 domain-containing protein [Gemmatimonadales bacterium]
MGHEILNQIGQWMAYLLWSLLLVAASLFVYLGLGGNFIIIGLALIHALLTGFDPIGWTLLGILVGLALIGEGLEFLVGTFFAARKGASRSGVVGAFLGGLLGAVIGNSMLPVLGAVLGGFGGAFLGAVTGEYRHQKNLEPSLRIGALAFSGRLLAIIIKHIIGLVMVFLILKKTNPF